MSDCVPQKILKKNDVLSFYVILKFSFIEKRIRSNGGQIRIVEEEFGKKAKYNLSR